MDFCYYTNSKDFLVIDKMVSMKLQHVALYGLIFFLVSSPYTYTMTDRLVQSLVRSLAPAYAHYFKISEGGCPTTYGLVVHGVVFSAIVYALHGPSS